MADNRTLPGVVVRNRTIVAEENNRKYVLENPDCIQIVKTHSDGDLYLRSDSRPRCDYILSSPDISTAILIELKGKHIDDAVRQIGAVLTDMIRSYNYSSIFGRIVSSRVKVPDIKSNEYRKLEKALRSHNGNLYQKNKELHETIYSDGRLVIR